MSLYWLWTRYKVFLIASFAKGRVTLIFVGGLWRDCHSEIELAVLTLHWQLIRTFMIHDFVLNLLYFTETCLGVIQLNNSIFWTHHFFMSTCTPLIITVTFCSVKEDLCFLYWKFWINITQAFCFGWLQLMNKVMSGLYPPNFIPAWGTEFDLGTFLQKDVGKLMK